MLGDLAAFASYVLRRIASGENTPFARRCLSETGTYSVLASFRVYVGVRAWGRGCRVWGVRFSALGTSG